MYVTMQRTMTCAIGQIHACGAAAWRTIRTATEQATRIAYLLHIPRASQSLQPAGHTGAQRHETEPTLYSPCVSPKPEITWPAEPASHITHDSTVKQKDTVELRVCGVRWRCSRARLRGSCVKTKCPSKRNVVTLDIHELPHNARNPPYEAADTAGNSQ